MPRQLRAAWSTLHSKCPVLCEAAVVAHDGAPAANFCLLPLRAGRRGSYDTPLVYPGDRGGRLNLNEWRRDEWHSALDAAGLPKRGPYAMRHTFASFAIAAGVSLFYLARLMETSVEQIDKTYGHLLPDSEEYLRAGSA